MSLARQESLMSEAQRERTQKGTYAPEFGDDEFTTALSTEPLGTQEVADRVGCEYRTAYDRLKRMEEEESSVTSQKFGGSLVWLLGSSDERRQ